METKRCSGTLPGARSEVPGRSVKIQQRKCRGYPVVAMDSIDPDPGNVVPFLFSNRTLQLYSIVDVRYFYYAQYFQLWYFDDGQYLSYLGEAGKIGIITWACFTLDSWYDLPVMVAVVYAAISLFMVWKILAEEDASSSDSKVLSS